MSQQFVNGQCVNGFLKLFADFTNVGKVPYQVHLKYQHRAVSPFIITDKMSNLNREIDQMRNPNVWRNAALYYYKGKLLC